MRHLYTNSSTANENKNENVLPCHDDKCKVSGDQQKTSKDYTDPLGLYVKLPTCASSSTENQDSGNTQSQQSMEGNANGFLLEA